MRLPRRLAVRVRRHTDWTRPPGNSYLWLLERRAQIAVFSESQANKCKMDENGLVSWYQSVRYNARLWHFISVACINISTWRSGGDPPSPVPGTPHGALFHMYRSSDKIGNSYYGYETTGERNWCQWLMSSAPPELRYFVYPYAPQASSSSYGFT